MELKRATGSFYRLSPMQEGMLYHHLRAQNTGVDVEQLVCSLHEPVDTEALRYAWEEITKRHAVMRTSFRWEDSVKPLQIVHDQIQLPLEVSDLRALSPDGQTDHLNQYLENDRLKEFDWDRAPMMRLALFHLSETEYRLIWSFHHAILDGRSFPIVLDEVFRVYDARRQNRAIDLSPVHPYSDYIHWLDTLDLAKAEVFWRDTLKNFRIATPLSALETFSDKSGHAEKEIRLSEKTTNSLRDLSTREGFSLNTVVQGAWALLLSRYSGSKDVVFGATRACRSFSNDAPTMVGTFINTLPVRVEIDDEMPLFAWLRQIRAAQRAVREHEHTSLALVQSWSEVPRETRLFESILVFENYLLNSKMQSDAANWKTRGVYLIERTNYPLTIYGYAEPQLILKVAYERGRFSTPAVERMLGHFVTLLENIASGANSRLSHLEILTADEKRLLLSDWNNTHVEYHRHKRVHELIEDQTLRSPDAIAVVFRDEQITYRELDHRANQLARFLVSVGVNPEDRIGICMRRSLDMLVSMLAVLKAGCAYVPLDPAYPSERVSYVLSDAQAAVLLTQEDLRNTLSGYSARVVAVDGDWATIGSFSSEPLGSNFPSDHLAYVLYTSGSTGQPKGVMVSHRNVVNFFKAMDEKFGQNAPGVWLAVTSISFDISVLELFWTLSRGFKIILQEENYALPVQMTADSKLARKPIEFSLFYFASDESLAGDKYRLLTEGARFADQAGFRAIWTPERHFHPFGGLFPNPAITSAALAMITKTLQIRAGSVVLPLHNPIRVAEEWSVVDNLSQGRVGLSFASGWHDRDFVFAPENYSERKKIMLRGIDTVRALWRGESIAQRSGSGKEVTVGIFPRPVQPELPFWITAGGDPQTFRLAGEVGANLLTHLLGQSLEELKAKVAIYRNAASEHGGGGGHVTLMLHTFVGQRDDEVEEVVRKPFCNYLKSSIDLMKQVAKGLGEELQGASLNETDLGALIDHAFHRYFAKSGLFGTPDSCLAMIEELKEIGVDEVACLVDFGIATETVLANLENLQYLMARANEPLKKSYSLPEQITAYRVTHMQCTPSLARMILNTSEGYRALGSLQKLLVGGETLSASLANDLFDAGPNEIWNMYGPTETTVWSTVDKLVKGAGRISIGRPIANTTIFVLDERQRPVPVGVSGELYIGGEGVVRGYLNRPELTRDKFVTLRFGEETHRVYRTGDLVRYLPDGRLEFLGRLDHQVKIRGHRVELGEIEAMLSAHPGVREAIVSAGRGSEDEMNLVAYLTSNNGPLSAADLRSFLESKLPTHMLPGSYVFLNAFPLTPNGKIDRNLLPKPEIMTADRSIAPPRNGMEARLAQMWAETLRLPNVGIYDNFFELGGHSLSAISITAKMRTAFSVALPLQTLLDNPTIAQLSVQLERFLRGSSPQLVPVPPPIRRSSVRKPIR